MQVHVPTSIDEVLGLMGQGTIVAGCTGIFPHLAPTESIISLRKAGLSGVETEGDTVRVGATTTLTQLAREVPFLREAIASIASPTIRNMATVGGNLFAPQPHGDLAVCLLALDAEIERNGDLVTGVSFKVPEQWFYTKAMRRKQNSASIVTVASDGTRIALGGVAREPVRALAAEAKLAEGDIDGAAEAALEAADPFDDAYASAWYRRRVLPVHVRRALTNAV
ncbi:FAD binding domain-containing protein [Solirubrobacter sp. CPCC 204708]|uniref:FAD binding domain-containing protein n=1 Tax=Solirubrobacter deserti TaxID=2282478 RepID=A0ABT4RSA5_9ACTN|nr:FAD binding domain-containing protein [Solirubrobacter deserti]MBE2314369.1 FAD binding domain-containing protein [Solirubrobacter deserti]MDA0141465.1 FAD binding domain-containing protein [Solirubrobacter deserti]